MKKNILLKCVLSVLMVGAITLTILTNRHVKAEEGFWTDYQTYSYELNVYSYNDKSSNDQGSTTISAWDWLGDLVEYRWDNSENTFIIHNYINDTTEIKNNSLMYGIYIIWLRNYDLPVPIDYFETGWVVLSSQTDMAIHQVVLSHDNSDSAFNFEWSGGGVSFFNFTYEIPNNVDYINLTTNQKNKFFYDVIKLHLPMNIPNSLKHDGYTAGYDDGYDAGVDAGIPIGQSMEIENASTTTWIHNLSSGIGNILDINIAPNIKLGYLILVPIVFGLVVAILKIVRG